MIRCIYCSHASEARIDGDDASGVCPGCWELLKRPETALPLMRGHLTASLRGKVPKDRLVKAVEAFLKKASAMRPS